MYNHVIRRRQFASTTKKPFKLLKKKKPFKLLKKRNPLNFDVDSSETMPELSGGYLSFSPCEKPMILRQGRKFEANLFRTEYIYGSSMDRKTCIWSCDGDSWLDKSSGIMWVGVHGMDSICVVTRTGDLDIKRVFGSLKNHTIESFLHHFRKTVIAEIEDLADPSSKLCPFFPNQPNKLRQRVGQSIKRPFGIVSVGTDEVHKESGHEASNDEIEENKQVKLRLKANERSRKRYLECVQEGMPHSFPAPAQHDEENNEENTIKFFQEKMKTDKTFMINESVQALEYDVEKAIKHLREKMESDVAFTMDKTIQAAISAFQHLFQKKFKADEIGVTVMDPHFTGSKHEAKYKDIYFKELEIHDIEKHLAVINEPGCGGGNSTTVTENG